MPTNIYSSTLSAEEVVFAELCLDTSEITLNDPHVIDIITDHDSSTGATEKCVPVSVENFEKLFYGRGAQNISFTAEFALNGSGTIAQEYYLLDNRAFAAGGTAGTDQNDTKYAVMGVMGEPIAGDVNLVKPIVDLWEGDIGCGSDRWSTCSYMTIKKEIDASHDIQNLDCNICCSLAYGELLGLLDALAPLLGGTYQIGTGKRTRVVVGDKVGLRILYKNAYEGAKDVEVRVHYQIV